MRLTQHFEDVRETALRIYKVLGSPFFLVRPVRFVVVIALGIALASCVKMDLEPLPPVTQMRYGPYETPVNLSHSIPIEGAKVPALVNFINGQRQGWTRMLAGGFGMPRPVFRTDLYEGDRYIGYFAMGAGASPGSHAEFEVQYGKILARKRVTKAEANQLLDLIGPHAGQLE